MLFDNVFLFFAVRIFRLSGQLYRVLEFLSVGVQVDRLHLVGKCHLLLIRHLHGQCSGRRVQAHLCRCNRRVKAVSVADKAGALRKHIGQCKLVAAVQIQSVRIDHDLIGNKIACSKILFRHVLLRNDLIVYFNFFFGSLQLRTILAHYRSNILVLGCPVVFVCCRRYRQFGFIADNNIVAADSLQIIPRIPIFELLRYVNIDLFFITG